MPRVFTLVVLKLSTNEYQAGTDQFVEARWRVEAGKLNKMSGCLYGRGMEIVIFLSSPLPFLISTRIAARSKGIRSPHSTITTPLSR